jgi:DNA mismatch repair protein MutL
MSDDRGIQVLPPSAAERIAAGEVVERPASVVKELIENSLDAGARRITVELRGAGRRLIRVTDDGEGIAAKELSLAFQRFATSKIRAAEDLQRILTFGFRGEALPSIAAVARVEMVSRVRNGEASRIVIEGGAQKLLGPASGPVGTAVTVENLFFNTPARRRFLKSPAREVAVIIEVVEALALAAPDAAFRLIDEEREILWYPVEPFADRAKRVLGPRVAAHTLELSTRAPVELDGILGTPQVAQPRRTHQRFLVNRRPVRSPLLARALTEAYHTLIPDDRYPAAVLALRLPPEEVDANVHPRKAEVRFTEERRLFDAVAREVRRALHRVPLAHVAPSPGAGSRGWAPGLDNVPAVLDDRVADGGRRADHPPAEGFLAIESSDPLLRATVRWPSVRVIGQLALTYIVGEARGNLILIDQHAAHERVLYERLRARRAGEGGLAQGLVTPVVLDLAPREAAVLPDLTPALRAIGFEVEPFGPGIARLVAVPAIAAGRSPEELFRACLHDLEGDGGPHAGRSLEERLAIATACHTAVRAGDPLDLAKMADLVEALGQTEDPFSCFHGRPTMIQVRAGDLERWFYRRT